MVSLILRHLTEDYSNNQVVTQGKLEKKAYWRRDDQDELQLRMPIEVWITDTVNKGAVAV